MGRVLLAQRKADSALVCIKFLKRTTDRRTGEQECRALLRLRHPGIVTLLDFSLQDEPPWLVTEYASGPTLHEYLKEHAPLTVGATLEILEAVLQALDYAHSNGVIHRDLKPANLIVHPDDGVNRVRILDFGLAIMDEYDHEGRITALGADTVGTLLYMAPEQFEGRLLTPACDIYAIGLMAWEMLMGRHVFEGKNMSQMMFEKVTRTSGLTLEGKECPETLATFVERSTRVDPGSRPTTKEALAMLRFGR
jgi:eukaryotic-like serine/threonine-protein kinase